GRVRGAHLRRGEAPSALPRRRGDQLPAGERAGAAKRSALMNDRQLAGKTCLVTGASRGLGRSIARRFWEGGASLVLAVRDPSSVESLVSDLGRADGQSSVTVRLDLEDVESARSLIDRTVATGVQRIDVLVNNAAVLGPIGKAWETSTQAWNA